MAKIKSMKVGIKGMPLEEVAVKSSKKPFKAALQKPMSDPSLRPATIVSRLKHNTILSYMGEGMVIAPNARRVVNDYEKLGAIPKGITVIPHKK